MERSCCQTLGLSRTVRVLPPLPKTVICPPSWRARASHHFSPQISLTRDAGDVEQLQQNPIAALRGGVDQPGYFALFENALCQAVAVGPEFYGGADIEGQVPGLLGEGEQRL